MEFFSFTNDFGFAQSRLASLIHTTTYYSTFSSLLSSYPSSYTSLQSLKSSFASFLTYLIKTKKLNLFIFNLFNYYLLSTLILLSGSIATTEADDTNKIEINIRNITPNAKTDSAIISGSLGSSADSSIGFLYGNLQRYDFAANGNRVQIGKCRDGGDIVFLDYSQRFGAVVAICDEANHAVVRTFALRNDRKNLLKSEVIHLRNVESATASRYAFDFTRGLLYFSDDRFIFAIDLVSPHADPYRVRESNHTITGLSVRPEIARLLWTEYDRTIRESALFAAAQDGRNVSTLVHPLFMPIDALFYDYRSQRYLAIEYQHDRYATGGYIFSLSTDTGDTSVASWTPFTINITRYQIQNVRLFNDWLLFNAKYFAVEDAQTKIKNNANANAKNPKQHRAAQLINDTIFEYRLGSIGNNRVTHLFQISPLFRMVTEVSDHHLSHSGGGGGDHNPANAVIGDRDRNSADQSIGPGVFALIHPERRSAELDGAQLYATSSPICGANHVCRQDKDYCIPHDANSYVCRLNPNRSHNINDHAVWSTSMWSAIIVSIVIASTFVAIFAVLIFKKKVRFYQIRLKSISRVNSSRLEPKTEATEEVAE